jgi:hypothetical protein
MEESTERKLRSPRNPFKDRSQFVAALTMDLAHMGNAAQEIVTKIGVASAILCLGSVPHAVGQNGFQLVVHGTADIRTLVQDDSDQLLANTPSHEATLLEVQIEAFFRGNDGNRYLKTPCGTLQYLSAGKRQVIGIPGVNRLDRPGKPVEPSVEPAGT